MRYFIHLALVVSLFNTSFVGAEDNVSHDDGYRAPIYDGVDFKADYREGKVFMEWSAFEGRSNEDFEYYKILRSYDNANPIYPEDAAIGYKGDVNDTSFVDAWPERSAHYRVCVITLLKSRYCSNVSWIDVPKNETPKKEEKYEKRQETKEGYEKKYEEKMKYEAKYDAKKYEEPKNKLYEKKNYKSNSEAFQKFEPKVQALKERIQEKLVDNSSYTAEQKIKKLKTLKERFYAWKKGSDLRAEIYEYINEYFDHWIEELEQDTSLDDLDSLLEGIWD